MRIFLKFVLVACCMIHSIKSLKPLNYTKCIDIEYFGRFMVLNGFKANLSISQFFTKKFSEFELKIDNIKLLNYIDPLKLQSFRNGSNTKSDYDCELKCNGSKFRCRVIEIFIYFF